MEVVRARVNAAKSAMPKLMASSRFDDCAMASTFAMPTIFTYAPAGMALSPYSTSPRRNDQMRGPNPIMNSVTFMPARRAIT